MNTNSGKQINPLQNLFVDIDKILKLTEFKDQALADASEINNSKEAAEVWMAAMEQRDTYITYKKWWTIKMFREIDINVTIAQYEYFIKHPMAVPMRFQEHLLEAGREAYKILYVEYNTYYRMLIGLPPYGSYDYIYMSDELAKKYDDQYIDSGYNPDAKTPVHELQSYIQNTWMYTDDYKEKLAANPDAGYLKYLGVNKIDLYTARKAKDFDIIRYPSDDPDINPNLLTVFSELYADYREYVMVVLYNEYLKDVYVNYRTFVGQLILFFVLLQLGATGLKGTFDMNFIDDTILHTILEKYNIDDNIIMNRDVKRRLVRSIPRLTREKGTQEVYYDLVDILGYTDVTIRKLMLHHSTVYDEKYKDKGDNNTETYFVGIDLKDQDPYRTIVSNKAPIYPYRNIVGDDDTVIEEGIAESDPRWWVDDPPVKDLIENGDYNSIDTKYITIESSIHQMDSLFELIYFSRLIFDNKSVTENITFSVPGVFNEPITVFDTMLTIIALMIKMDSDPSKAIMKNVDDLLAVAGFNFDLDKVAFDLAVSKMEHVDADRIGSYIKDITVNSMEDIGRLYNNIIYPLRIWLENKIASTENRKEFLEYEAIYKALYTYDIRRTAWIDDFKPAIYTIADKYSLSEFDMKALIKYYSYSADTVIVRDSSQITPATDQYHIMITNEHGILGTDYAQCHLSIYDILTSEDLRELTVKTSQGESIPVFMTASDGQYKVNQKVVNYVLTAIDNLSDNALAYAEFQVDYEIDGEIYSAGTKLPESVRASGVYKSILKDKVSIDMAGPPKESTTFEELLAQRPNVTNTLYALYQDASSTDVNKDGWMDKMMNIITTMENLLGVKLSYIKQLLLGEEQFFKPLVTLINHFKSIYIDIAKTNVKHAMDDKMDVGGNSNMFKIFDDMELLIHFTTIANSGYNGEFGLYDTINRIRYHLEMNDITSFVRYTTGEGFAAVERNESMGSMRMSDEARFFLDGKDIDGTDGSYPQYKSYWYPGEGGSGRWTAEDDFLMKTRLANQRVKLGYELDLEGWKEYVESYNPE